MYCGGDSYFGALCNSFIHVLMYSYYLMAALKISCPWKKILTKLQMIQFLTCIGHAIYLYVHKTVPPILPVIQIVSAGTRAKRKRGTFASHTILSPLMDGHFNGYSPRFETSR